jgi:hypothetical protein
MEITGDKSAEVGIVDQFLAAPREIKNKIISSIGAKDDDDAITLINSDTKAYNIAKQILEKQVKPGVLTGGGETAPEDVLYPRAQ